MNQVSTLEKPNWTKLAIEFQLTRQLKHFGLSPKDWQVIEIDIQNRSGKAELSHRKDQNLRLKGKISPHLKTIKSQLLWQWDDLAWDL